MSAPASDAAGCRPATLAMPSSFYRGGLWRAALALARILPRPLLQTLCLAAAELYYALHSRRRAIVTANLRPVLKDDPSAASRAAHRLFRQFALKLAELWRFESGIAADSLFTGGVDWAIFEQARARGQGVLLVTPHLGNWELGGVLLARRGVKLLVLTQAEPGAGFTQMRMSSRSRWGIETLVVGGNGFDFVEIIRRLQDGANVALLIDRPPVAKAVTIELFGRPFAASIAAAELARASGCALLGVTVLRAGNGYRANILPEFHYDRASLGDREARRQLTQQVLRAFEPAIRDHPDQWFHFVPVWSQSPPVGLG